MLGPPLTCLRLVHSTQLSLSLRRVFLTLGAGVVLLGELSDDMGNSGAGKREDWGISNEKCPRCFNSSL